ncbi:MAG: hypothetical protein ABSD62_01330 [Candidatus Limnocylindrales bacterium]|jgi:hypothetical protein
MALPQRITELEPLAVPQTAPRIRRCTFRRLSRVDVAGRTVYEVSCLYPDRRLPLPLGDLESSAAVCTSCLADHVFRPDED